MSNALIYAESGSSPPVAPRNGTLLDNSARSTTPESRTAPCHCGSGRKYKNCHLRHDKEQERLTKIQPLLLEAAIHEAGHAIAAFDANIPIGDEGVWISEDNGFSGFADTRVTEKYGKGAISSLSREQRQEYFVGCFIGPVVEWRHRGLTLDTLQDRDIRRWSGDFAAALCIRGVVRTSTRLVYSDKDCTLLDSVAVGCFWMFTHPETDALPLLHVALGDIGQELKEAMLAADKLATTYADDIKQFADLLVAKGKVTKEECAEMAHRFQKSVAAAA